MAWYLWGKKLPHNSCLSFTHINKRELDGSTQDKPYQQSFKKGVTQKALPLSLNCLPSADSGRKGITAFSSAPSVQPASLRQLAPDSLVNLSWL